MPRKLSERTTGPAAEGDTPHTRTDDNTFELRATLRHFDGGAGGGLRPRPLETVGRAARALLEKRAVSRGPSDDVDALAAMPRA
jgi:hypothetical protein